MIRRHLGRNAVDVHVDFIFLSLIFEVYKVESVVISADAAKFKKMKVFPHREI